ncbi:hypothetical protein [Pedobacter caeni]|uniref:Uncharacterized protein n=1 Tax=Pedobacter caeni TaxID=288992 RepID=A0A1M5B8Y0_9SPHI|nr:hypothetical protein [Pedobacter caeni]SHF38939.1 hypothetical protein SAMN04488522_1021081 [Pedobacter caeni]
MKEIYKHKLEILRNRIPIGISQGLSLLEKTGGNIEEAENCFREERLDLIVKKTGVSAEMASTHLLRNNFDVAATLTGIEAACFTLTEIMIRRGGDRKEEALEKIAAAVEKKENLTREYWLHPDQLGQLEPEVFCVVMMMEWLSYDGWEDFESALYFHLDVVTDLIQNQLLLPEVATTLIKARTIAIEQAPQQKAILEKEEVLSWTPEFTAQHHLFNEKRSLLLDTLYAFVKNNIDKFP